MQDSGRAIWQWLSQRLDRPLEVLVAAVLLIGLVGTVLWWATRDTGSGPSAERIPQGGAVHQATAFASVEIVERDVPQLARVVAIPSSLILLPGETTVFTAAAFDQFGRRLNDASYNWQLVDPAAGSITPGGIFRASFTEGTYSGAVAVIASPPPSLGLDPVRASANISIRREATRNFPASIQLFPRIAEAEPGQTIQLTGLVIDTSGILIPGARPVWDLVDNRAGFLTPAGRFTAGETPGNYPGAIRVSLPATTGDRAEDITSFLDVLIVEATQAFSSITLAIIPQGISLRTGQTARFTAVALDQRSGQRLDILQLDWRVLDPAVGAFSQDGQFQASDLPGIYSEAVEAVATLPSPAGGPDQELFARATVAILGSVAISPRTGVLRRVAIFPEQVVLSTGESTRLIVVGMDEDGQPLADFDVQWSLDPELGEVSPFVEVKAGNVPGIYPDAIRAVVTVRKDGGVVTQEVSSDLIILGPLDTVIIEPPKATVGPGGVVRFRAQARDVNGILLSDVSFHWEVVDERAGKIEFDGSFRASQAVGEYPDSIKVTATQRIRGQ